MKKYLTILLLFISVLTYGQLDTINIGTAPNDGTGESLRSGMIKVNIAIRQINTLTTSSTNWNTAYTDRLKWDGGATGLVAATGRTSLGATTVGEAFFMLTNPSAITFVRINADNSITALSAANFKTALSLTATDVGLGNVTNESKATMFTNATFTGTTGGITATMVGLGNLTNKLQVEVEDSALMAGGYTSYADGIAGLALKLNKADSALMAGGYFSYSDGILKLNKADSALMAGGYFSYADGITGLALKINKADSGVWAGGYVTPKDLDDAILGLTDTVSLETIAPLLADSSAFWAVFGTGRGILADTTAFENNAIIGSTTIPPSDTIHAVTLSCKIMEGSGTELVTVNICWDNDSIMSAIPIKLNTSGYTVTNLRIENNDVSFNNNDIPPGSVLYGYISGITAGNKPSYLECTLSGYKYNRSY